MEFIQNTFLVKYFLKGGIVMWPLLFTAILALTFIIERWYVLWRSKIKTDEFINRLRAALLKRKSAKEAIAVCEEYQGPIANILKAGLIKYGSSDEEIEKAIEIAVNHELARLERGLAILGSVANIAPLMGFLGTVTGMIKSFAVLAEAGMKKPDEVARGISEALITTATGLAIAIPAALFYNWFSTKISRFILEMETGSNMLLETFAAMETAGSSE